MGRGCPRAHGLGRRGLPGRECGRPDTREQGWVRTGEKTPPRPFAGPGRPGSPCSGVPWLPPASQAGTEAQPGACPCDPGLMGLEWEPWRPPDSAGDPLEESHGLSNRTDREGHAPWQECTGRHRVELRAHWETPRPLPRQLSFLAATVCGQVCTAHASAFRETQLLLLLRGNGHPHSTPPLQGQGRPW